MPRYSYRCDNCGVQFEKIVSINQRHEVKCGKCGMIANKEIEFPQGVFIGMPGAPHEGRPDEFWERSEKHKQKGLSKRKDIEKQKLKYGDKEALAKEERKITNYRNAGETEKAVNVERKLESL